jgi:hypothetical protein
MNGLNEYLYLEEDISISASNTYEDPLQKMKDVMNSSPIGQTINQLSALFNVAVAATGFRLQTRFSALEAWTSSSKLRFSTKFSFNMGSHGHYSGLTEVYSPIVKLGSICLPTANGFIMQGPGPNFTDLMRAFASDFMGTFTNKASEIKKAADAAAATAATKAKAGTGTTVVTGGGVVPTISTEQKTAADAAAALAKAKKESEGLTQIKNETSAKETDFKGRIILFKIGASGRLFDSKNYPGGFIPKEFSYTFSKELDSNGYPISGTATISWESFVMATAQGSFGSGG